MNNVCANCVHMSIQIERHGLKPVCNKNKIKFKSRVSVDWDKDKDVSTKSCNLFSEIKEEKENV